jgi:predicted phosphodiesterase
MNIPALVAASASAVIILYYLVTNSPWLTKGIPTASLKVDSGAVMVLSDLHIDANPMDLGIIGSLAGINGVNTLVIAGDLFNYRIRVKGELELGVMVRYAVERLGLSRVKARLTVLYLMSSSSHDPEVHGNHRVSVMKVNNVTVVAMQGAVRLSYPDCIGSVYITHGDYAVKDGVLAGLLSFISLKLLNYPLFEVMLRRILNVNDHDWVISGHTHVPVFNSELKVANPGSWVKALVMKPHFGYVTIRCSNGELKVSLGSVHGNNAY